MASFNWTDAEPGPLRIPSWAAGSNIWRAVAENPSLELLQNAYTRLRRLTDERPLPAPTLQCPRVFISHRSADLEEARRAAWLATLSGFQYWLDADDVALQALPGASLSPEEQSLLTAILIEIALVNCSHVLAVITDRTRGSMWVPYEYGRVKTLPVGLQAACWLSRTTRGVPISPEYLQLGLVTLNESQIEDWLRQEVHAWVKKHGTCRGGANETWHGDPPETLLE